MSFSTIVLIPYKDKHELTIPLVQKLRDQYAYEYILLLDNGSSEETQLAIEDAVLDPFGGVSILDYSDMNLHQMWNYGLDIAE